MYKINFQEPIHIHFIGIGGISMSGLAEILFEEHFTISGSDSKESELTRHLEHMGMQIFYGQKASNIIEGIDLIVYTAAIREDNPEFAAAKEKGIPMLSRAELLGQIMDNYQNSIAVSGTHGKTTTTSMISQILLAAKKDPTITVGGILKAIDGNLRVGKSDVFISEACEYTNSFLNFRPKYSIILNIEAEHLDFFKDIHDIRNSFHLFAKNTKENGAIIINGEIENYQEIVEGLAPQVITYGMSDACDFYPADITFNEKACANFTAMYHGEKVMDVALNCPLPICGYPTVSSVSREKCMMFMKSRKSRNGGSIEEQRNGRAAKKKRHKGFASFPAKKNPWLFYTNLPLRGYQAPRFQEPK